MALVPPPIEQPDPRLTIISSEDDIRSLVDRIYDPTRYQPLLVVTCATDTRRPRVDLHALLAEVDEAAEVVLIRHASTAWTLTNYLPEGLRTYGGAIRMFWPYAKRDDPVNRHPHFLTMTEASSPATIGAIRRTLVRLAYLPDDRSATGTSSRPTSVPAAQSAETTALVASLKDELQQALDRAGTATAEANALRRQVRTLTEQVTTLNERLAGQRVFTDPDEQFRHEVWLAWLNTTSAEDRARYPLRTYTCGPDFLDSVEALEGVDRSKIVSTVVDVVSSRVWTHNGRNAHQHRINGSPGAPTQAREDGSLAWRCSVQNNTPSARRLMWWEIVDGTVELAKVGVHDDVAVR